MPELPEVEAISAQAARAVGQKITCVEVIRGNYALEGKDNPLGQMIEKVFRRGKYIMFILDHGVMLGHNAMTGYWDLASDPWTFDYVEGPRKSEEKDVRIRISLSSGDTLRFHDTRLFGRLSYFDSLQESIAHLSGRVGPELIQTALMFPFARVIDEKEFVSALRASKEPVKNLLMDQRFLAGVGNIYSSEACHAAGVDPLWPACSVPADQASLLFESLVCVCSLNIPKINYAWLNVYRRQRCGTCDGPIVRDVLKGRATFSCPRCQWEP